jgi:hypothetical protein
MSSSSRSAIDRPQPGHLTWGIGADLRGGIRCIVHRPGAKRKGKMAARCKIESSALANRLRNEP